MLKRSLKSARLFTAPESEIKNEVLVQVIGAPKKSLTKKTQKKPNNISDVIAKERQYQKKIKWLKDHQELSEEERRNQGEE